MLPSDSGCSSTTDMNIDFEQFPLYSLPHVPLTEALGLMDLIDVAELSFISKNSTSKIKSSGLKVNTICLSMRGVQIWKHSETPESETLKISKEQNLDENSESRMIDDCEFRSWTKDDIEHVKCVSNADEDILKLFNHFNELFKVKEYNYMFKNHTTEYVNNFMTRIPNQVQNIVIGEIGDYDESKMNRILDHCSINDLFMCFSVVTKLHEKMNNLGELYLYTVRDIPLVDILCLRTKRINLAIQSYTSQDVTDALNLWKTEQWECESLHIHIHTPILNVNEVQELLNAQPWNPDIRDEEDEENDIKKDQMIIERNDGVLASIGTVRNDFVFKVWEKKYSSKNVQELLCVESSI